MGLILGLNILDILNCFSSSMKSKKFSGIYYITQLVSGRSKRTDELGSTV